MRVRSTGGSRRQELDQRDVHLLPVLCVSRDSKHSGPDHLGHLVSEGEGAHARRVWQLRLPEHHHLCDLYVAGVCGMWRLARVHKTKNYQEGLVECGG